MKNKTQKILVAMTGASGSPYTQKLLGYLIKSFHDIYFIYSDAAKIVSKHEINWNLSENPLQSKQFLCDFYQDDLTNLTIVDNRDWFSSITSGSNSPDQMIICPASMGTVAAISQGLSDNVLERAADVCLKERKKLIIAPRETPFSTIHLENLLKLSRANAIILPLMPGFYNQPKTVDDLIEFVVARILNHLDLAELSLYPKWGN